MLHILHTHDLLNSNVFTQTATSCGKPSNISPPFLERQSCQTYKTESQGKNSGI